MGGTTALVILLASFGLGVGILIGRYYMPDDRMLKRSARHAASYLRAMNHVLARDRDAAITELIEVVRDNVHDVEPYFALGALFRARGEHERAIRVHQSISLWGGEDAKVHQRALYELGLDFRRAGMPRRATAAFEECVAIEAEHLGALRALAGLYEEQGRFRDAAAAWQRLRSSGDDGFVYRQHHLLVAAAQVALDEDAPAEVVRGLLEDADTLVPATAHSLVTLAQYHVSQQAWDAAQSALLRALALAPELAPHIADALCRVEDLRDTTTRDADEANVASDAGVEQPASPFVRVARVIEQAGGQAIDSSVLRLTLAQLRKDHDPDGMTGELAHILATDAEFVPARVLSARAALERDSADAIRRELEQLVADRGVLAWAVTNRWRCGRCGHHSDDFFWRCSSCRSWGEAGQDVGRPVIQEMARERRQRPRGSSLFSSGDGLPAPTLRGEHGVDRGLVSDEDSLLGRIGGWWRRLRRTGDANAQKDQ